MFVQDNLQNAEVVPDTNFPNTKFFLMVIGVVIGPFALFAIGGGAPGAFWRADMVWTLPGMALLLISAGVGWMMFKRHSYTETPLSIRPNFS